MKKVVQSRWIQGRTGRGGICSALGRLGEDGKLHHGSGKYDYGDWSVWL